MTTKFRITATAPTSYQYQSLANFGKPEKLGNGSFRFQQDFETEEEAKKYLIERAEGYYDDNMTAFEQAEKEINDFGQVTLDAVTGYIEEIEGE